MHRVVNYSHEQFLQHLFYELFMFIYNLLTNMNLSNLMLKMY